MYGLLLKPRKGSGAAEGLLSREGAHFLGWYKLWEMKGCGVELLLGLEPLAFPIFSSVVWP
jgi:hypothetical protein